MHLEADGIKIHYRVDGREGAPWLTFINGIANDTTMWDGQVPELEADFRILRYDAFQRTHKFARNQSTVAAIPSSRLTSGLHLHTELARSACIT